MGPLNLAMTEWCIWAPAWLLTSEILPYRLQNKQNNLNVVFSYVSTDTSSYFFSSLTEQN